MKKRILSICVCLALFIGMAPAVCRGFEAKAADDAFALTVTTDNEVKAGAEVTYNISATNTTEKKLAAKQFTHAYFSPAADYPDDDNTFGVLRDAEGNEVTGNPIEGLEFEPNETKNFTLTGTIPSGWGRGCHVIVHILGADEEDSLTYTGEARYGDTDPVRPGDDAAFVWEAYRVTVTPDQEVKPGAQVVFQVEITNTTGVSHKISWLHPWYYQETDNSETYPGVDFGEMSDAAGNKVTDENAINIVLGAGETKKYTVAGTIPSTWGNKSEILIVLHGYGTDGKWYGGQGGYPDYSIPENIVEVITGSAGSEVIPSDVLWVRSILTEEELSSGDDIEVVLNSNKVEENSVSPARREQIRNAAGNRQIAQILDLTIQKNNKTKNTVETVSKLFAPIHITIQIPEEYRNVSGREFSIIRLHGDTVTVLEDLDDDPNTITISTDEFSLYALAYTDGAGAAGTVVSPGTVQGSGNASASGTSVVVRAATPQTGDTANIAVYLALSFTAAVTIAGIFIKRRQAS